MKKIAQSTKKTTVAIAGTTHRTLACARALYCDPRFEVKWIMTPDPKPIGRKKIITPNPMHKWGLKCNLPIIQIKKKIDQDIRSKIESLPHPDILLVVDFGYLVPQWLLNLPLHYPLNVHPSELPRWRGSSPGQFCLLYGDKNSAITLIIMDEKLDHGPIVTQLPFTVNQNWSQVDYYNHSFRLMTTKLADIITNLVQHKITPTPQPDSSPTVIADKLNKNDAFIPWEIILAATSKNAQDIDEIHIKKLPPLLQKINTEVGAKISLPQLLHNAIRAFNPWPVIWTKLPPNSKYNKSNQVVRMKIFSSTISKDNKNNKNRLKLDLDVIQIAGKTKRSFSSE